MLGKYELNKIYLEDCFSAFEYIPSKSIDCIYVDVPYLFSLSGSSNTSSALSKRIARRDAMLRGGFDTITMGSRIKNSAIADISNGFDYVTFIKEAFRMMKNVNLFIWCSTKQIYDIMAEIKKYTKKDVIVLVWTKTNPIPAANDCWLSDVEYCLHVRDGVKLNGGYELKSKHYQSPINQSDKILYDHPTIKPLELVKKHLLHATQPNDIILDCFVGSGTTAVACIETGRRFLCFEKYEPYYRIAQDRINGMTQKERRMADVGFQTIFDFGVE